MSAAALCESCALQPDHAAHFPLDDRDGHAVNRGGETIGGILELGLPSDGAIAANANEAPLFPKQGLPRGVDRFTSYGVPPAFPDPKPFPTFRLLQTNSATRTFREHQCAVRAQAGTFGPRTAPHRGSIAVEQPGFVGAPKEFDQDKGGIPGGL